MKKRANCYLVFILMVLILSLTACQHTENSQPSEPDAPAGNSEQSGQLTPEEEYQQNILANEFTMGMDAGEINYDDDPLQDLPKYTYERLLQYAAKSDGAYAEAAGAELLRRFQYDAVALLEHIAALDDDEAQQRVISLLAGQGMIISAQAEEYQETINAIDEASLSPEALTALDRLKQANEESAARNSGN